MQQFCHQSVFIDISYREKLRFLFFLKDASCFTLVLLCLGEETATHTPS